ncbi:hypothetical protein POVWA2_021410 [Plasmodium ovale wallikeri]|uniref:Secreted protein n=1 Tax=Plasmodium ovale wallikeri TaxID=864142 RepID=A0A1A8YS65_PLAOA|nr:hypothetical protein POVWA1_021440 [Plasmodium ovale wallikeri]SBT34728.1 hypothetical protein POVWA2_021410 [Plasmodium ovale wallikeri]
MKILLSCLNILYSVGLSLSALFAKWVEMSSHTRKSECTHLALPLTKKKERSTREMLSGICIGSSDRTARPRLPPA